MATLSFAGPQLASLRGAGSSGPALTVDLPASCCAGAPQQAPELAVHQNAQPGPCGPGSAPPADDAAILAGTSALYAASAGDVARLAALPPPALRFASPDMRTPLHAASIEGRLEAVAWLIEAGVDLRAADRWGHTALSDAAAAGHHGVVALLTARGAAAPAAGPAALAVAVPPPQASTPQGRAGYSDRGAFMSMVCSPTGSFTESLAHSLSSSSLADGCAGACGPDGAGGCASASAGACARCTAASAAAAAAAWGSLSRVQRAGEVLQRARDGDLAGLRALRAADASIVRVFDYDSRYALHLAAAEGHEAVVQFLLSSGAEVNPLDRWGRTPLEDALAAGHTAVVQLLSTIGGCRT